MKPILCGNLEYEAWQSDLERLFGRYGKVDRVDVKSGLICLNHPPTQPGSVHLPLKVKCVATLSSTKEIFRQPISMLFETKSS